MEQHKLLSSPMEWPLQPDRPSYRLEQFWQQVRTEREIGDTLDLCDLLVMSCPSDCRPPIPLQGAWVPVGTRTSRACTPLRAAGCELVFE